MLRSFASVQRIDLGFEPDRVATAEVILPTDAYPGSEERRAFMDEAVTAMATVPGVTNASAVRWLPLNHESIVERVASGEMAGAPEDEWPMATANFVYPGYFETMGISLLSGRGFAVTDGAEADAVVAVNRALADRWWPGGGAVGQTLLIVGPEDPVSARVVAVVEPVNHVDLDPNNVGPQYYRPALQSDARRFFVLGRTDNDPAAVVPGIRTALGALAPELPLTIRPMEAVVAENQMQWSIGSVFLGIFGGGALLLATLGIYGLVSFSVAQRGRELGVRIALGASRSEIRRSVVVDGLKLTGIGVAVGLVLALGAGQLVSAALYGVDGSDPVTLAGVLTLFLSISALASFVPAARASSTDPISVLRSE
jgi:predicted permease